MKQGPNVRKLIAKRVSVLAIPSSLSTRDAFEAGFSFLIDKNKIIDATRKATTEIEQAIAAVKSAPDNQLGDDDEAIAGEILRQIDERDRNAMSGS